MPRYNPDWHGVAHASTALDWFRGNLPLRFHRILGLQQVLQLGHEFAHILEVQIHGCEAHVGDFVMSSGDS